MPIYRNAHGPEMPDHDRPIPTYSRLASALSRSWHGPVLLLAVFLFAALVVYAPALGGSFISDDEHYVQRNVFVHDPIAIRPEIDLTLRWDDLGADQGEVFISGDVTGPNTGTWIPLEENLGPAWPDFMTLPVTLTGADGDKFVYQYEEAPVTERTRESDTA